MNNLSELAVLDVEDFEIEAVSVEVETAAARGCASTSSCCNCSTTPELSA
ncbi:MULTISPECIES: thiazolylpeptide-type bacteriocin [unclassified Streptomyces]